MTTIAQILDQIDLGVLALPEFQRGYVWNQDQIRDLFTSLYRGYPVGSLLLWKTSVDQVPLRGDAQHVAVVDLILDGQQRVTSLYGVMRGRPPRFFIGKPDLFDGLHFDLESEKFAFRKKHEQKTPSLWIDVSAIFRDGIAGTLGRLARVYDGEQLTRYLERLNRLHNMQQQEPLYLQQLSGADKTLDVVVEIFHRVNTGGTLDLGQDACNTMCGLYMRIVLGYMPITGKIVLNADGRE